MLRCDSGYEEAEQIATSEIEETERNRVSFWNDDKGVNNSPADRFYSAQIKDYEESTSRFLDLLSKESVNESVTECNQLKGGE